MGVKVGVNVGVIVLVGIRDGVRVIVVVGVTLTIAVGVKSEHKIAEFEASVHTSLTPSVALFEVICFKERSVFRLEVMKVNIVMAISVAIDKNVPITPFLLFITIMLLTTPHNNTKVDNMSTYFWSAPSVFCRVWMISEKS